MPSVINCANYVYFQCMQKVVEMGDPAAAAAFTEQLLELHRGQGLDIYWRDNLVCPTEEQYRDMVKMKTGGLFMLAVRLMQLHSPNKADFRPLLDTLGLYFQIRDDYANLKDADYAANKSYCEDLTEGKFSFPIIHSIHVAPHDKQVLNILRQRTEDNDLKRHAVSCMERLGSFAYTVRENEMTRGRRRYPHGVPSASCSTWPTTVAGCDLPGSPLTPCSVLHPPSLVGEQKSVLNDLVAEAKAEIDRLGGNDLLRAIVDKLAVLHTDEPEE